MSGTDYRNKIELIKMKMLYGSLTYEEAKVEAQPIIDEMNQKAKEIAHRHRRKHKSFTFGTLMR